MNKLATFEPIIDSNPDSIKKYYEQNNISLPNNQRLKKYLNMNEEIENLNENRSNNFKLEEDTFKPSFHKGEEFKSIIDQVEKSIIEKNKAEEPIEKPIEIEKLKPKTYTSKDIINEINSLELDQEDKDFLLTLGKRESSYRPYITNELGYYGLYQFGNLALKDVGLTKGDFKDTKKQHEAALKLAGLNEKRLKTIINNFSGKTVNGVNITRNGIRAAAHLLGAGTVKDWFNNTKNTSLAKKGFKDANDTSIVEYLELFGV